MSTLALLLLLSSTPRDPGQAPWGLTWNAPLGCIQHSELVAQVEGRLGRPVFGPKPALRIDGLARRATSGWVVKLTLVDRQGTVQGSRDVRSTEPDCRSLDPSLSLVLAVMIDPLLALALPELPSAPTPVAPPADQPVPPPEPEPVPIPAERPEPLTRGSPEPSSMPVVSEAPEGELWAGLLGGLGPHPGPSYGVGLGVRLWQARSLFAQLRLPFYPYLPISGGLARGSLSGGGLGAFFGTYLSGDARSSWAVQASVGLEATAFLTLATEAGSARVGWVGRTDALVRLGLRHRLEHFLVGLEGDFGATPGSATVRLVTPDGRPVDLELGGRFRSSATLALIFHLG